MLFRSISGLLACSVMVSAAEPIVVASPDGTVTAELSAQNGNLRYRVLVDGKQVLAPSVIGIRTDDVELGQNAVMQKPEFRTVNETYPFHGGKSQATNNAKEAAVPVMANGQSYVVDLHVANDGVGVRLRLPAKQGRKIQADNSSWKLDGDPVVWAAPLDAPYESTYVTTSLSKLEAKPYGMPLTAKVGTVYVSFTEAALKDYGDLAVKPGADGSLDGVLSADPKGWTTNDAVVQPWRVTMVARDLTTLVNSTLVHNLNPPASPELAKATWIVPGRSTWQWLAIGGPKFKDQHQWVDWTAEMGYEYYLVDEGWGGWPEKWDSLASVCTYAASKGVKIWLWVHSKEVRDPEARLTYFRKAASIGIAGIKTDFPPPANRWWSTWYHDTARDAAACKLMLDFHGANKPTGMERTWPNVLTREGVRGHEWQITRYKRTLDVNHDTILPFTRYLAGPGDYTPTVFAARELQGNTWSHELAQSVIFTSPFMCFGGHPKDFVANPAKDVLSAIPAVWDETRVLPGSEPGTVVAMARRSGKQWFVAVINGGNPTKLDISCDFLGAGTWKSTLLGDVAGKDDAWNRQEGTATERDHLRFELRPKGGFIARFQRP